MTHTSWGEQALEQARAVARDPGGRGSATRAEARAAAYVQAQLAALGIQDVRTQPFQGLRSIWLFLALAFGCALVGHAAYWLLRGPVGEGPALGLVILAFGFSGLLLWRKFTFQDYPLRQALPHGPSQNVIAVLPPGGDARRDVVLLAHLDSHRAVWGFATDTLVRLYALLAPLALYGVWVAPLLYLAAILTPLKFLAWIGLLLGLAHFIAWFTGMTADLGPYSPGANDNASAVGGLLALAARLKQEPLRHTRLWLVFTGCEETGCDGLINFLKEYGPDLKEAFFLDFELVGIGDRLVYLQREGLMRPRRIHPEVEKLLQEVGGKFPIRPFRAGMVGAFTEMGVVWEKGYRGVCLLVQQGEKGWMPEWHRLTDRAERLEAGALEQAHHFAWALLQKLDQRD